MHLQYFLFFNNVILFLCHIMNLKKCLTANLSPEKTILILMCVVEWTFVFYCHLNIYINMLLPFVLWLYFSLTLVVVSVIMNKLIEVVGSENLFWQIEEEVLRYFIVNIQLNDSWNMLVEVFIKTANMFFLSSTAYFSGILCSWRHLDVASHVERVAL